MDNTLNARIKLKYDTLANWNSSTFIPLAGEVCIAYITTNGNIAGSSDTSQTNTPRAVCIKVGDGTHTFSQLPWIQAIAADVYEWAKASTKPSYNASEVAATEVNGTANASTVQAILTSLQNTVATLTGAEGAQSIEGQIASAISNLDGVITGTPGTSKTLTVFTQTDGTVTATFSDIQIAESQVTNLTTDLAAKAPIDSPALTGTPTAPTATAGTNSTQIATTAFVKNAVDTATAGLTGAMHFIGKSTIDLSIVANESADPTITGYDWNKKAAGDVVLNSTGAKEYVWNGTKWLELGDEGSYAVKGSITNSDIASNAAIAQTKIAGSTANTTLADDLAAKQDSLGFTSGTAYNKTTNPVATQSYVDSAAAAANTTYTFATGDNDGQIKVTPSTNGTAGIAVNVTPKNLKTIATSANAYDLNQVNTSTSGNSQSDNKFFILDCGDATHFIDNASTT